MGNACCANKEDDQDTLRKPGASVENDSILTHSEMLKLGINPFEHKPPLSIAIPSSQPELRSPVKEVWGKKGPMPKDSSFQKLFNDLPTLGPFRYEDGSTYTGQYRNGLRHGYSCEVSSDGSIYSGYWLCDYKSLKGRFIMAETGDCITGMIQRGKICGEAECESINGVLRTGNFEEGKLEGLGTEVDLAAKTQYRGEFMDGEKEGWGVLKFEDGSFYEGNFNKGKITGQGKRTWVDKRSYEGEWLDGKMNGKGVFRWDDGKKYEGEYRNNVKFGFGEIYFPNGDVYKGGWADGKMNGEGEYIAAGSEPIKGQWKDGLRI